MNVSVNCLNRHSKQFLSDFLFCGITLQYFPLLRTYFFTFFTLLRKFPCLSRNYQPFNFLFFSKFASHALMIAPRNPFSSRTIFALPKTAWATIL